MSFIFALIINLLIFIIIYSIYYWRKSRNIARKLDPKTNIDDILSDINIFIKNYYFSNGESDKLKYILNRSNFSIGKYVVSVSREIKPNFYYLAIQYDDIYNENINPARFPLNFEIKYKDSFDFVIKLIPENNFLEIYTNSSCSTNEIKFLVIDICEEIIKYIKFQNPNDIVNCDSSKDEHVYVKQVEEYYKNASKKFAKNDFQSAILEYNKVIEIAPDYAKAFLFRGISKEKINDINGAIDDYSKSVSIAPDICNVAYGLRGKLKDTQKDYLAAIEDYNITLNYDSNNAGAYFHRGKAKNALNDYTGAICDYSKSIECNAANAQVYFFRGVARASIKDIDGEISDYSMAINIDSNFAEAFLLRGVSYINKGLKDQGFFDLKKAIELGSDLAVKYFDEHYSK